MTLEQFKLKLLPGINTEFIGFLDTYCLVTSLADIFKQLDPEQHKVHDKTVRRDKQKTRKNEDGTITDMGVTKVARLSIPIQKKIVLVAAAFLGSPKMQANNETPEQDSFLELMEKIWDDNKLDWKFKQLAKKVMSETHAAELFYFEKLEADSGYWDGYAIRAGVPSQISTRILAPSTGDTLLPVFDDFGKLIAFGRRFKTLDDNAREVQNFDLYTADTIYHAVQNGGVWDNSQEPNPFKKIPVIYYRQEQVEWADVQHLIERLETKISNHADTNDYFDSPIVVATGNVQGFAGKDDSGKLLQADADAKVEYLTWNQAPESTKMEIENLVKFIYQYTHTPDISFESMKGLGVFSGIALKMLFLDAHLKAADKAEIFGEGLQRRINFMKSALVTLDTSLKPVSKMKIEPKFEYFLPEDTEAKVTSLVAAVSGKIMSQESAIAQNPYVMDPETELTRISAATALAAPAAGGLPGAGDTGGDTVGKIPLAIQQLTLAATRAREGGDSALEASIKAEINRLIAKLGA
jgi:SPP1 family phage portal protein